MLAPLPWAARVKLLVEEPNIPYCDGDTQPILIIDCVMTSMTLVCQTAAPRPTPGHRRRGVLSSSGAPGGLAQHPDNRMLPHPRSYIDAPQKLGRKFDVILDDGRAMCRE